MCSKSVNLVLVEVQDVKPCSWVATSLHMVSSEINEKIRLIKDDQ